MQENNMQINNDGDGQQVVRINKNTFTALGQAHYEAALNQYPAQVIVDMQALKNNMQHIVRHVRKYSNAAVMGVVKADAYGHGLVPVALAALAGGATWLGTAQMSEALYLRACGITEDRARIITWLYNPSHALIAQCIEEHIDLGVGSFSTLEHVVKASQHIHQPARVHIKIDSGFGRNGFVPSQIHELINRLVQYVRDDSVDFVGLFSHLAVADTPDDEITVQQTQAQIAEFDRVYQLCCQAGIKPKIRHIANTAATLLYPQVHYELVRPGIALYGYEPDPSMGNSATYHLQAAMTLQAQLASVKPMVVGSGISYGRTYVTTQDTSTAIIPIGYADGLHRSASGYNLNGSLHEKKMGGPVQLTIDGKNVVRHIAGRICMDQCIVDLEDPLAWQKVHEGDTVTIFGAGRGQQYGEPNADDWAVAAGTISYEIFTCLRSRIPRLYTHVYDVLDHNDITKLDESSILS